MKNRTTKNSSAIMILNELIRNERKKERKEKIAI